MAEQDRLVEQFETHRGHLQAVAYRMLGSQAEAEDAVQETWLRLNRIDQHEIRNLAGWLTTVVARISLDILRTRRSQRAEVGRDEEIDSLPDDGHALRPEDEAEISDAIGPALMLVLDTLAPGERLAFVLHDLFGVPFDEIAVILNRSPDAARQLSSRARRRVRSAAPIHNVDLERQRAVVSAFLQASRAGDFDELLKVLDPEVVVRADQQSQKMGMKPEVRGATAVLNTFLGKAVGAQPALINGVAGLAWAPHGRLRAVISLTVEHETVTAIDLVADPTHLELLEVDLLDWDAEAYDE